MDPLNDPRLSRRRLLELGGLGALSWAAAPWLPAARADDEAESSARAKALIVLWLNGGPSQLETFDPHPGSKTGGPTKGVKTKLAGVEFGADYARLAERADELVVIRSMVTKEGEHNRGRYLLRTGFTKLPTVQHPAVSAVVAHELEREKLELPKHVALLSKRPPRGGYLGAKLNAFAVGDPKKPLRDLVSPAGAARFDKRLKHLELLEKGFRKGRAERVASTQHEALVARARRMMKSKQIAAFDYRKETQATIDKYGDSGFGRSCLVARRLLETGVPAIEVSLDGWDTHVNNFELHSALAKPLDQAFAALLDDLKQRKLLDSTIVLCGGEFGRTPRINPLTGRDHWTRGFSLVMAGGGLRKGVVVGATDPAGEKPPTDPVRPRDVFATVYELLGIDRTQVFDTPQGRPVKLSEGKPLKKLIA